jgi:NADH:ubiquinone oxidoreductase subunit 2 (subunit N)
VVAFIRNQINSEELDKYRGLVRRSPWMVLTLSIFLLSLLGLPPLIGFPAKYLIFSSLWKTGKAYLDSGQTGLATTLIGLFVIGGINTVVSAVYYLKVMRVMIIESRVEDIEGQEPVRLREPLWAVSFAGVVALVVLAGIAGFRWVDEASVAGVRRYAEKRSNDLNPAPAPAAPPGGAPVPGGPPGGGRGGGRGGANLIQGQQP